MSAASEKLAEYERKRDFSKTAEPRGAAANAKSSKPVFVVQKHDATRLHFDFRLEWDGVLLSWAVTRGPSDVTSVRRLAVRTEDHPLDYGGFEGTIAKKQYGAGTVMLWDHGWWQPKTDFDKGLADGQLKFILHGDRMKGGWTLVRLKPKPGEKRENWLLIKERDDHAGEDEDALVEKNLTSVATGRKMEEIAAGKQAPLKTRPKGSDSDAPKKPLKLPPSKLKADAGEKTRFTLATPKFTEPQLAKLTDEVPEGEGWLHETKFDGYRCLAALGKDGVRLYTRSGLDWAERYLGLPEAFEAIDCRSALIDGEVVTAHTSKGSAFSALQDDLEKGLPVRFMAFDLIELDGKSLRKSRLAERKELLEKLLANLPKDSPIRYSEHVEGHGDKVFAAVEKGGGEGIISKSADSLYAGTRNGSWLKIKTRKRQEFVVGGYSPSSARHRPFASLLVGTLDGGVLRYRGRVGGGFDEGALDKLMGLMKTRERKTSPFDEVPGAIARGARWMTPDLVVEVDYAELTDQDQLRHAVYLGVREDKEAGMVHLEKPGSTSGDGDGRGADGDAPASVLGVRVTHPGRIMMPEADMTKGDLARYYARAGERMTVLAGDRPVSLLRCPSGRDGDTFFQKHAGKGFPDEIDEVEITESSGTPAQYMVIRSPQGFVAAAQMGTVEFHIWGARTDDLEKPDRLVFDLDPDEGLDFGDVKAAAKDIRDMLKRVGLDSVAMVTGGKGVHVIVPLRRVSDWETVTGFARTFAHLLAHRRPERYVATMSKAKRKGKIFIDWLRNDRGSTAVAPYSVRARANAPVAVPVTWQELARLKSANSFDTRQALKRLGKPCPLLEASTSPGQSISRPVVEALEKLIGD
ncbi:ATP-dependent DNA ligase LigD phosphoesterase module /ATP-dependent DNA ligase LigD polymerase module [Hoeflea marina]|uniref:DNA ligase (ATP) n=1 Tax=Hoeflea marina TaxID=274592 RepID=A0A317PSG7_9HYPH|nr:DNA ligase D [Hoeflea marina]PWW03554.1 ATP-dependent DNA ligase LigD phosphoesterase module /ATP-dependent DNA ligase LigD polymerase module [Hoeflea marina]